MASKTMTTLFTPALAATASSAPAAQPSLPCSCHAPPWATLLTLGDRVSKYLLNIFEYRLRSEDRSEAGEEFLRCQTFQFLPKNVAKYY